MGINLDELGKKLHKNLDSGIEKLKSAQSSLMSVEKETESAVHAKMETAKKSLEEKKEEAAATKDRFEKFLEEKKSETTSAVSDWKAKHEVKKLEKRADKVEKYAESAISLALYYA
ncbi:MAG: hypothetical protein ACR2PH_14695, partial [Desulfobulbia bacterium]